MSFLVPARNVPEQPSGSGPVRPSEFRESVEERTEIEAPADYPTPDESGDFHVQEQLGYPAPHGEPTVAEPVGVYQVLPPPDVRVFTDWQPDTIGLNAVPTLLAAANRRRTRLVVRNLDDTAVVYLSRQGNNSQAMGAYAIPAGTDVEIFHNSQVYAYSDVDGTQVTFFVEYDLEEPEDDEPVAGVE